MSAPYYGQFDTDKYIEEYFPGKTDGVCIEVGAVDGIHLSNTLHFEQLGWDCLTIEPQLGVGFYDSLKNNRKNAINYAVSSKNEDDVIFYSVALNNTQSDAVSSLNPDERLLHQFHSMNPNIIEQKIPTRRLDWCIENYFKHDKIDFISIDVEGTEIDVLRSFDVNAYGLELLVLENNFNDADMTDYLNSFGWKLDRRVGVNNFYIKES